MRRFLTILAAGTLALSACSDDSVGPSANYSFVVVPNQEQISLVQDDSATVSVVVQDTVSGGHLLNPDIDWSSDDPDVAVVEENGDGWQVRAVGEGSTQLHAVFNAYDGPVEATIDVSVTGVPAESFTLGADDGDDNVSLYPGDADTLRIVIEDANGDELSAHRVEWENSADSVASVEQFTKVWTDTVPETNSVVVDSVTYYAVVTAKSVGSATIVADVEGKKQTVNVTVAERPVDKIVMTPDVTGLHVGDDVTIAVALMGANGETLTGREVMWNSTDASVATVDSTGKVTAVGVGTADIKARVENEDGSIVTGTTSVIVIANPSDD